MGKDGKKYGGRDWKPGESGNPNGRPPLPPELRKARAYNRVYVQEKLTEMMELGVEDLQKIVKDPKTKVIDAMVASVALYGIKKGDQARLNFLMERTIGKVPQPLEHSGNDGAPMELIVRDYREKPDEE